MSIESNTRPPSQAHRPRASIKDVAAHAGVSAQTVSRVANQQSNVRPDTRDKVLASMRELGYRPNSAARNLKSGRFRSIGVVTFNMTTLGNERTLDAVSAAAAGAGYTTTLLPVLDPTQLDVAGAFGRLEEQAVDGIILIMSAKVDSPDALQLTAGLPLVIVDSDGSQPYNIVDMDQELGARQATRHLIELGHKNILHVCGPETSFSARRRKKAFERTIKSAKLPAWPILTGDWTAASGQALGWEIVAMEQPPTAVFAANDQMALGLMSTFHQAGWRIPADISIVGFDDSNDSSAYWPALTTVHQNFAEVGKRATDMLLAMIAGLPVPKNKLIPTTLVIRDSTARLD